MTVFKAMTRKELEIFLENIQPPALDRFHAQQVADRLIESRIAQTTDDSRQARPAAQIEHAKELLTVALMEADALQHVAGVMQLRMLLACLAWVLGDPDDPHDIGFTEMIEDLDRAQLAKGARPN
jgi:hypothetical protein